MNKKVFIFLFLSLNIKPVFSQTWIQQNAGIQDTTSGLSKISIVDANTAWCISNYVNIANEFSRTTTGGNTWVSGTISSAPSNAGITGLAAIDSNTAFICASIPNSGGQIYKTTDGGISWQQSGAGTVFTDTFSFPNEIYFWDAANGFVFGDPIGGYNQIYLTNDSGNTWTQVPSTNLPTNTNGTVAAYSPLVVIDSTIFFPGFSGHLFKSTDKGNTWSKIYIDTTVNLYGLSFLDDKLHGIAISFNLNTYLTSDGGNTWNLVTPVGATPWYVIRSIPGTNYFVSVSEAGYSTISSDMGYSWSFIDSLVPYSALAFKDMNTGYAGGTPVSPGNGGIYKWDRGTLGIQEQESIGQLTVYPNPASSQINIKFDLKTSKNISATIYDMTGREVKKLLNEKLDAGQHTITWNMTNETNQEIENGIYVIKFDATGLSASKPFTVIK